MSDENFNLDEADLPSLHKKFLTKVIIFPIFAVMCLIWTIYAIITYINSPDLNDYPFWFSFIVLTMIAAPIAGIKYLSLTSKNRKLLRKVIQKQKGIEPKDTKKYYFSPDPETLAFLKKKAKYRHIYSHVTTLLSSAFMIFYLVGFLDADWVPRLANFIPEVGVYILADILTILGIISSFIVLFFLYALFDHLTLKIQQKWGKKSQQIPLDYSSSLKTESKTMISNESPESEEEEFFDDKAELIAEEDIGRVKVYINSNYVSWGYVLIWTTCFVIGIPLKIFLPFYISYPGIELSPVILILSVMFWIGFAGVFIVNLINLIPVWRTIKKLEIKIDSKL
ncbi:MAG: hypothetical protein ACTSWW_02445 [Promethearchaeota archaeon]